MTILLYLTTHKLYFRRNLKIVMKKIYLLIVLLYNITNAQVGIGNANPMGALDITSTTDGLIIPRIALVMSTTATCLTPTISELIYNTATTGDVTPGFYYWTGTKWSKLAVGNNNDWAITGNASTTAGTNFIGTTDAQDLRFKTGGTDRLNISNTNGQVQSYFGGTDATPAFSWNADSDTGILHPATDNLSIATGGVERVKSTNAETTINDLGNDYDFRIESDNKTHALFADATRDAVIFGSTGTLYADGTSFSTNNPGSYSTTIDYVADFDNGLSRGTTMGLGSIEYLVDGEAELFVSDTFSPNLDKTFDLGFSLSWDDIYADDFWNVSDIRAKKEIQPMQYGLKEVLQLNTISYKLKDDPFQDKKIGLIAQEVNKLIPEASKTEDYKKNEKGEFEKVQLDTIRVSYVNLVPVLVKAVQEQQEIINLLKEEVELLKNKK